MYEAAFQRAACTMAGELLSSNVEAQVITRGYVDGAHLRRRLKRLLDGFECNVGQLRHILLLEFWLRDYAGRTSAPVALAHAAAG
jgi:hypothetical protein